MSKKNTFYSLLIIGLAIISSAFNFSELGDPIKEKKLETVASTISGDLILPKPSSCPELITNNEFDSGTTDWKFYVEGRNNASFSIDNNSQLSGLNSVKINISATSGTDWHVQMYQKGITLDATKTYILSFDAKAVSNRSISIGLQERGPIDWRNYWYETTALTTSMQSFSYEITPSGSSSANAGLMFYLGKTNENVFIDNVSFKEKCDNGDCGTINSVIPTNPSICPALNNGQITITPTDANFEYSIDGGNTYVSNATFSNLTDGTYTIRVRHTSTNCFVDYINNPVVLIDPTCTSIPEICGNGIDDDQDGEIDSNDTDCSCPSGIENMALGKTVSQSGTTSSGVASLAIDGNTNGDWNKGSVSITNATRNNWWQVDLESVRDIKYIKLWNRTNSCCIDRNANFYVFVSDTPFTSDDPAIVAQEAAVWNTYVTSFDGKPSLLVSPNRLGRYIRVQLTDEENLALAEVEVFGCIEIEDCSDGVDNDNDGLVDCADNDCSTSMCQEICNDGIDNDGDGYADCFDEDCPCYAPFDCDNTIYQSINPLGPFYNLYKTNYDPVDFDSLFNLTENGLGANAFNSIGFNPVDRFIYGINHDSRTGGKYNLFRINALGEVANLGKISGMSGFKQAGAIGPNGEYYIYGFDGDFFKIDIATRTATTIANLDFIFDDMAVSPVDGLIYGWKRAGRILVKINPDTGVVTEIGKGNPDYEKFGSLMFNAQNEIIAYGNNATIRATGQESLVKIDPITGVVTPIGTGPDTDDNDGCSCAFGIELTKGVASSTIGQGEILTYTFTIHNRTGAVLNNITFNDVLKDGFVWNSEPQNITGLTINNTSISGTATADFTISDVPVGEDNSFTMEVLVPTSYCGSYLNQAVLTNIPTAYGTSILSDDPNTINIADATVVTIDCANREICNDGIDNDNDGQIDMDDSDCACSLGIENMALGKTTSQSSTFESLVADLAIDGNTDGKSWNGSITHTQGNGNDWWQIDLKTVRDIKNIKLWNRTNNCCLERNSNFYVFVSDTPFTSDNPSIVAQQTSVWNIFLTSFDGNPSLTISPHRTGRYIRVQLTNNVPLSLAEVEVFGCALESEICNDGIDNDGDGLIDCEDGDCATNTLSITPTTIADCQLDGSGVIDLQLNGGIAPYTYQWEDIASPTAHWNFDTTTNDISGQNHHQQLVGSRGTPSYSTDAKEGTHSLSLDGNTYIRYSADNAFMETSLTSFAVSFWMKPSNLTGSKMILDEGGSTHGLAVYLVDNKLNFSTRNNNVQINSGDHTVPNDNEWHYVLAVFQNNELSLYLDGNKGTTVDADYPNGKISFHAGDGGIGFSDGGSAHGSGSGLYYSGLLDGFRYYNNQIFTDSQLADLARNDGNRTGLFGNQNYTVSIRQADGKCATYTDIPVGTNCIEICNNNIDDDGDGLVDCNDGDCGKPIITSITPTDPNNCPDLDNGTITIIATGDNLEYSIDNGNTFHSNNQFNNLTKGTYSIRVQNTVSGCLATSVTTLFDSSCNENCTDGIDNNGDGQIDCEDDACGKPGIISVTPDNPNNCPVLDNGQITIIATGTDLVYSVDNGTTFQNARIFTNLTDGTYTIVVKNNKTGCEISHSNTITLTDPTCTEICDNGIDDDGDGNTDCADNNCGKPTIQDVQTQDPDNCPVLDNGTITITAIGSNLAYSIDNGDTYQDDNIFNNLTKGTYQIVVINSSTGCSTSHGSNVVLSDLICDEICGNEIDDDGDGEIDFQDEDCGASWPQVIIPNSNWLCDGTDYIFQIPVALQGFTYDWEFGNNASQITAQGAGPHTIQFSAPDATTAIFPQVVIVAKTTTYEIRDTYELEVRPLPMIVAESISLPSNCGSNDGGIEVDITKVTGTCVEISLDGGVTWQTTNKTNFNNLPAGSYDLDIRYCGESCISSYGLIEIPDPSPASPTGKDLFTDLCPGQVYNNSVSTINSASIGAKFSLSAPAIYGTIIMETNGDFSYKLDTTFCGEDLFTYTRCSESDECCVSATVRLNFEDTSDPILQNVPDDLTVRCDEEIPLPPFVTATDNCLFISIDKDETNTQGIDGCAQYNYSITRNWTASDACGNEATDYQIIQVVDVTAPDIFRIYTLPNGKKLIAGITESVYQEWKTVSFPIQFDQTPLVFTQVVTKEEDTPIAVNVRNISNNQFELKLQEEAANDNQHNREHIAWIAIEPGTQQEDYQLMAGSLDINEQWNNIDFSNNFSDVPAFFASIQTNRDTQTINLDVQALSTTQVGIRVEEETSVDTDITHTAEQVAYLAIQQVGDITDERGVVIGEVGSVQIDGNSMRIPTKHQYYNPVIIAQVVTNNQTTPVTVRVQRLLPNSFDIALEAWDYLGSNHTTETVSYLIIEGSIPLDPSSICEYGTDSLVIGVDMIAVDNCDASVVIEYEEEQVTSGATINTIRTWYSEDACGNRTAYNQVVECTGVSLQLKAFLQGSMVNNTTNIMRDDLRAIGLLPYEEPYTEMAFFTHIGAGGGEQVSEALMNQTGNDAIVDWVFIELMSGDNHEEPVATCSALIQRDGDIVNQNGESTLHFYNMPLGQYYVRLRHRNHLSIETAVPYTFTTSNTPFVDFSNEFTPVRGIAPRIYVGDKLALWSGDLNSDNLTIFQGPNNDVFYMLLEIILDEGNQSNLPNFISGGYTTKDFNMDGTVIFQGPNNDRASLLWNTVLNHPNNKQNRSNFIVDITERVDVADQSDCLTDSSLHFCDFDGDDILNNEDPDDDNDGVADGDDINPYDPDSDSDQDGISDNVETGGDGSYHSGVDSDPLSACDPSTTHNNCFGIDKDNDGYFYNYPVDHEFYDENDQDNCFPNSNLSACSCPDMDEDGFIEVCNNGIPLTIPVSDWNARNAIGNTCGTCEDETATPPAVNTDMDKDGFFSNVATTDFLYDPDDNDACVPDNKITISGIIPINPTNCPSLNDGSIIINANGKNLVYSIDNGATFTSSPVFDNLSANTYTLFVKNTESNCIEIYSNDITLSAPSCIEICDNGIDDDGNGLIDCEDDACSQAQIIEVVGTSPTNCPIPNNGSISINANGNNLVYSIDNGATFNSSPVFDNLSASTYTIVVKNTETNCIENYSNDIILSTPNCFEICDNGIDDDGDGLIDTNDTDCACFYGLENMALGKTASQSSTNHSGDASRAIDGNTNGAYGKNSVTHTAAAGNDWWQVDLGAVRDIKNIKLWNRTDNCCEDRLSDFYVFVSDTPFTNDDPITVAGQATTWNTFITDLNGSSISVSPYRTGRYIRIQKTNSDALSLAEVEVLGCAEAPTCTGCYETVQDGDWGSNSTWKNGNKPPFSLSGHEVIIRHNITVPNNNVTVDNNADLTIDNAELRLTGSQLDLTVKKGSVTSINSLIVIGDDLKMSNSAATLLVTGGILEIKKRIANTRGTITLDNAKLIVANGFDISRDDFNKAITLTNSDAIFKAQNNSVIEAGHSILIEDGNIELINSCAFTKLHWRNESGEALLTASDIEVEGDFINGANSTTTFNNVNLYLSDENPYDSGNLISTGAVNGQIQALYMPYGYTQVQSWDASITTACVGENNTIPSNLINSLDCNGIHNQFSLGCFETVPPISEPKVNLLTGEKSKASGTGSNGVPEIHNFTIPSGSNRQMIVIASFERNHCEFNGDCPTKSKYDGLGDNYTTGTNTGLEKDFQLEFRLKSGAVTKTKKNRTNDNFGNFHSARSMDFIPKTNNRAQEVTDYHKALYSKEAYFITYNEAEINALLGGNAQGDISIDFPNISNPTNNSDDAILMALVFENVAQDENGVALSAKIDKGKELVSATAEYAGDLQESLQLDEPTDGLLVVGLNPTIDDFNTMPGYVKVIGLNPTFQNTNKDSSVRGGHDGININGQFRHGLNTGKIDHVNLSATGVSDDDVLGSIILAFTLESIGTTN